MGSEKTKQQKGIKIRNIQKGFYCSPIPKFGCFKTEDQFHTAERSDAMGGFDVESVSAGKDRPPTHLIIMVNGIIGSAQNWRYAAKQFVKNYPEDVIVHCSESNSSTLTFDGVDVMGKRLADEVLSVVKGHSKLQKISFIGHSLGGLVARYAIAKLYAKDLTPKASGDNGECVDGSESLCLERKTNGKIAGLEPVNFITSATPHLGSRGHKKVPLFCGSHALEKVACRISWLLGRTGRHLFLTDSNDGKSPLLLQMVNDSEDLPFMSALQSFRRRVAYSNVHFDHLVGWSTSSLRHQNEFPKHKQLLRNDRYPHIVNIEISKGASPEHESPLEGKVSQPKTSEMEEIMLRCLRKLDWELVDVSFSGSKQKYLAHSTIQVKTFCLNSDGAGVIQHMVDTFIL